MSVFDATRVRTPCDEKFFFVLPCILPLIIVEIFFAYGQRYPFEILMGTGVIHHADYEYEIFFHRKQFLQKHLGVI